MNNAEREHCRSVSRLLKMLAHPTRLEIICTLKNNKNYCVNDICLALEKKQSNISQHLALLRHAGFIDVKRVGNTGNYFITNDDIMKVVTILSKEQ